MQRSPNRPSLCLLQQSASSLPARFDLGVTISTLSKIGLGFVFIGLIAAGWAYHNYYENMPSDQLLKLIAINHSLEESVFRITGRNEAQYNPLPRMEEARYFSIIIGTLGGFLAAIGAVLAISGLKKK